MFCPLSKKSGLLFFCLILLFSAFASGLKAQEPDEFVVWLTELRAEALAAGISPAVLENALDGVELRSEVLVKDRNQPEFKLSLAEYLDRVVSERRVDKGQRLLKQYRRLLDDVASRYGVQPRFLVALWGIETDFGRVLGDHPVIQSLATLAFDPRRSDYFRKELLQALHVINDGLASFEQMRGSWAGAAGGLQFMPSVFRRYGVDHNGDGKSDIWHDVADMLASGANYLAAGGWHDDQTWGREVRLPEGFDKELIGHQTRLSLAEWQDLGVRRYYGNRDLPERKMRASLIMPDQESGRAFLVYDNFQIILKWNRSDLFALSVGILADRIGEKSQEN